MDTVHSTRRSKVMLTFLFRNCSLMIALLIDSCSQIHVKKAIDMICEKLWKVSPELTITKNKQTELTLSRIFRRLNSHTKNYL